MTLAINLTVAILLAIAPVRVTIRVKPSEPPFTVVDKKGLHVCQRYENAPIIQFCFILTYERL